MMADSGFPLVEVSGSSYEMGYQHGARATTRVSRYLDWIEKQAGQPQDVLSRNALAFLPALQAFSPAFVEEVRGLADGAGISFEQALLCQVRGEAARVGGAESSRPDEGCTAFAFTGSATADGQPLAGQNQDLEPEFEDLAILLRVKPNDGRPQALMFTFAGQLGYAGMNEYGLAHFNNVLFDYTWRLALPRQPLKRVMLEQRTVAECIALLERWRICSAANAVLCDRRGIADVEMRPEGIALFHDERPDACLHTNHYLTPQFVAFETHTVPDSAARRARLAVLAGAAWGRITAETVKGWLADHAGDSGGGICRHGAHGWHTIAGYIAEPVQGRLHIRRGHGCTGTWKVYEVK
jgi:isopenicillin-N N-acyltransferase like protein